MKQANIRNFAIIAHIDHGKSTLADQIMALTQTVSEREQHAQLLDDMAVEQAHGVTVKARTVRNFYHAKDGQEYEYNLIDTPGHVDFSYEVAKSLAATEGALLLVDATQGVQAQTIANYRIAKERHLPLIPVLNKVDMAAADIDAALAQLHDLDAAFTPETTLLISAKTGQGVPAVLEAIKDRLPAPSGAPQAPLKALVFDSLYDPYQGVIAYVRLMDGQLKDQENLRLMQADQSFKAKAIGTFTPNMHPQSQLTMGDVGYVVTGIKDPKQVRVGETLTAQVQPTPTPLAGYQPARPMVFAGLYPQNNDYPALKEAIQKLGLNDPSFSYTEERSEALGVGFRCGFLGAFHLQIIRERLHDEYGVDVLTTAPNVTYHVQLKNGQRMVVNNPVQFPAFSLIESVAEPFVQAAITMPSESLNAVLKLTEQHKGTLTDLGNQGDLVVATVKMPLSEVAYHFFSELKSVSHGFASLSTRFLDDEISDLVKIEVDMNYAPVDALAFVVHREDAPMMTQKLVGQLKVTVPRQLYPTPVQARVEGKVLARVDVPPLRKNAAVNGEAHSVSKKAALLRRQSANKRRATQNAVKLPQSVFNAILEL
ncbi:translation elongation factor 4 [Levilactobacillus namurensis]|uniref:translation elongation factor 4 n=1 Tax=Levilactobacillus namurensis TaxID=380393 RepID=UPI001D458082|nr:translation elongation factor 4 [Levilactobacillus namurensis]HJE44232.1 translation elongation factor 4 [Levilactobacillus namurensis]